MSPTSKRLADNDPVGTCILPYGVVEEWTGDFNSGVLKLGKRTSMLHGLSSPECGLLAITRCYPHKDRTSILEIFEKAAAKASSFCYSSMIVTTPLTAQPVFCMGHSTVAENKSGCISGVFIFPALS